MNLILKKNVIIKLSVQNDSISSVFSQNDALCAGSEVSVGNEGKENQIVKVVTEGEIRLENGFVEIEYPEPDVFELNGQLTTLSFQEQNRDILTMTRNGICSSALTFESGRRCICSYSAFGTNFDMCVNTFNLTNSVSFESGGQIRLFYTIESGGMTVSTVKMVIGITAS